MSRFRTVYFASVAHDLRTPINTVLSINHTFEAILPAENKYLVDVSKSSCLFLLSLIDDIFDMSKFELDQFELNLGDFQLKEVIEPLQAMLSHSAQLKGIDLIFESSLPDSCEIHSDLKRLKQIIINLLSNAIKFTSEGFVKLSISQE